MTLEIKTNNQFREIIYWYDLTEKEKDELKDNYDTIEESSFFRYKNQVYDLNDFMRLEKNSLFPDSWHGYSNDSFFSGILIELSNCGDGVKVGFYAC
jgi:hypothetical protein